MYYTIYKVTNLINGKFYIGKHQTENIDDSYYGSGKAIKEAIKKYGKENFKKSILHIFNNELEMTKMEKEIITEDMVKDKNSYNIGIGGEGGAQFIGKKHNQETKEKLRLKAKVRKLNDETKKKISESLKGRVLSEESKKKISDAAKCRSEDIRRKISEKLKEYHKNKNK